MQAQPPEPTLWERWSRLASYPRLWIVLYALWIVFALGLVLLLLPPLTLAARAALIGLAIGLPIFLIWVSSRMYRTYSRQGEGP